MSKNLGGRFTRKISWWESGIQHPTRMKRKMNYSISGSAVSRLSALVLVGDFNLTDVC